MLFYSKNVARIFNCDVSPASLSPWNYIIMGELFIEVLWGHRHVFLETKESDSARELRLMLGGIFGESEIKGATLIKTSSGKISLDDPTPPKWEPINETLSFADNGVTSLKARPNDPFVVCLLFPGEQVPSISSLSVPPPLPDAMRTPEAPEN